MISGEKAWATLMNNYFVNITAHLDLKRLRENLCDTPTKVYSIKNSNSLRYFEN